MYILKDAIEQKICYTIKKIYLSKYYMSLRDTISEQQKEAMKAREKQRVSTLRILLAAIKQVEIDTRKELTDSEIEQVVVRQVKQLRDAIVDFKKGGRNDLVDENNIEIAILEQFLPEQLSDSELEQIVNDTFDTFSSVYMPQFGHLMGAVMKAVDGKADGNRVRVLVQKKLST